MNDVAQYDRIIRPHFVFWVAVIGGLALFVAIGVDPGVYAYWTENMHPMPDRPFLQWVLVAALALHVFEGWYCYKLANRLGLNNSARAWGWQSFALGYPSTRLLIKLRHTIEAGGAAEAESEEPTEELAAEEPEAAEAG